MKNLLVLLTVLTLQSCVNQNVQDVAAFEFDNAWYWVGQYKEGASQKDVMSYVKHNANPKHTAYFFVFPPTTDVSAFKERPFNMRSFTEKIVELQPEYGYYKMPNDPTVYDDGLWVIEMSLQ